ncbi:MAG: iron ABC transporter permease [Deltaproteobacteria bacterium]|nr:iron ABC transporter permease [Deltaproteobacteria bacterium]
MFQKFKLKISILILFFFFSVFLSLSVGVSQFSFQSFLSASNQEIILQLRLPRILLGALVGIALSVSGAAFQALLRNPLADPFILGVSGGAALGSVLAVGLHLPFIWVSLFAFGAALLSMLLIYSLAQTKGRLNPHTLLLVGVLFNTTTFALILFINALVSMEDLHRIWFLMVGSLEAIEYSRLALVAFLVFLGLGIIFYDASSLNLLTLGEENASLLGVEVERVRTRVFFAASLMVGAIVSVSGLIGFVGLAVPHIVRLWLGADHRLLIPSTAVFGASFLVLSDFIARIAFSGENFQTQLPVGVLTALIGAPLFFYLLRHETRG